VADEFSSDGNTVIGVGSLQGREPRPDLMDRFVRFDFAAADFQRFLEETSPDLIVHCAGSSSVGQSIEAPAADFAGNVELTRKLLESIRLSAAESRFILLSSAAVYGNPEVLPITEDALVNPISPYGFHKRQAELIVEEYAQIYSLKAASVRIFSGYGPGLRRQVVWDLSRKIHAGGIVEVHGDGSESRDFVHSRDIARAIAVVGRSAEMEGEVYNLASGVETTVRELVEMLLSAYGLIREVKYTGSVGDGVPRRWKANVEKIGALGFSAETSFENGIAGYAEWFSGEFK